MEYNMWLIHAECKFPAILITQSDVDAKPDPHIRRGDEMQVKKIETIRNAAYPHVLLPDSPDDGLVGLKPFIFPARLKLSFMMRLQACFWPFAL